LLAPSVSRFALGVVLSTHFVGTALTNISTQYASASFVNTIKAADPLFAVVLSVVVLKSRYTPLTYFSLVVIVGAIILACTTEFKFALTGFWTVMISNACFPTRAIYTKQMLTKTPMSGQIIFYALSLSSVAFGFFCALWELAATGWPAYVSLVKAGAWPLFLASISHYGYNFFGFILVGEVSSLTYSIGNSFKRLVTIYGSVIYFRNPVSTLNMAASLVAVAGVALYSWEEERVKRAAAQRRVLASAATTV